MISSNPHKNPVSYRTVIIPIFQVRQLRHREVKQLPKVTQLESAKAEAPNELYFMACDLGNDLVTAAMLY